MSIDHDANAKVAPTESRYVPAPYLSGAIGREFLDDDVALRRQLARAEQENRTLRKQVSDLKLRVLLAEVERKQALALAGLAGSKGRDLLADFRHGEARVASR